MRLSKSPIGLFLDGRYIAAKINSGGGYAEELHAMPGNTPERRIGANPKEKNGFASSLGPGEAPE
jgi:hypothetical protein